MRRMRKGFTLVELLIVVSIMGALSATMMVSVSGSTARAKAAAIARNVETLKNAAALFYIDNMENASALEISTSTMLDKMIPVWRDFNRTDGKIKYTPDDTTSSREGWIITVDFSKDGEVEAIKTELARIAGYGQYDGTETRVKDGAFKVTLYNGAITAATPTTSTPPTTPAAGG